MHMDSKKGRKHHAHGPMIHKEQKRPSKRDDQWMRFYCKLNRALPVLAGEPPRLLLTFPET